MRALALLFASFLLTGLSEARTRTMRMTATAFDTRGETAAGTTAHRGVVAADPALLPLGSRIYVSGAGPYSGYYTVQDTGSKIVGSKLDIFIPDHLAARQFGKKLVRVRVLRTGAPQ